jgi:uncharacterized protein (DUF58 family)
VLPAEIVAQIRRLQLTARRAVADELGGAYHSIYKGAGLAFEEVREYQPGDDVRSIDWNVTARAGRPYIKRYIEERQRTLLLMVDISGSTALGSRRVTKRTVAAEVAALLAMSASANGDAVGLIAFTDRVEHHVRPARSPRHITRLIYDILCLTPQRPGTSLRTALDYLQRVQRRRAIVFLISDFLDQEYQRALLLATRRYDVTAVRIRDPLEHALPAVGRLRLRDSEQGTEVIVYTGRVRDQKTFTATLQVADQEFAHATAGGSVGVLTLDTSGQHLQAVLRYFRQAARRPNATPRRTRTQR